MRQILFIALLLSSSALACRATVTTSPGQPPPQSPASAQATPAPAPPPAPPATSELPTGPFQIQLHRAVSSGYRERVMRKSVFQGTKSTKMGQRVVKREVEAKQVELEAVTTVMEVDGRGRRLKTQYVISKCRALVNGQQRQIANPGQTIVVERGDPPVVTVDGRPVPEEVIDLLDLVLSTNPPRDVTDDGIFGTTAPQPVGASWPLDSQVAATDLSESGMIVSPQQLSGQTTLVGIKQVSGMPSLELRAEMQGQGVQLSKLPPGASARQGDLEMEMTGLYPVDLTTPQLGGSMRMRANFVIDIPNAAPNLSVEVSMERHQTGTSTPL